MQLIGKEEVREMLEPREGPCVTITMPLERMSAKARANGTKLRNLLRQALRSLLNGGMKRAEAEAMLEPGHALAAEGAPWHEGMSGLAFHFAPGYAKKLLVPISLPELAVVGSRFYIKPLLSLLGAEATFAVLALSSNSHRLVRATRFSTLATLLEGPEEGRRPTRKEKQLQFRSAPSTSGGVVFHGHGAGDELKKEEVTKAFREVARAVSEALRGSQEPLVVACVEYLFPLYRDVNNYPHLVGVCAAGNPDEWTDDELRARAWQVVEPVFGAGRMAAAQRYREAREAGKAADNLGECLLAAQEGRLEVLYVPVGIQAWGRFDSEAGRVEVRSEPAAGDEDLLNLAAALALAGGAAVYAVHPDEMPEHGLVAGLVRY
ncbi:MAG: hypothetical protein HRF45_01570 [Fimbriimonadia bacterium]|jgi:hypothetical protein